MTATANIQTDENTAVQNTNKIMGDGTMNHGNDNINLATRLSNVLRMGGISKFVAVAALGLTLTIGLAMPGAARADAPYISGSGSGAPAEVIVYPESLILNDDFSMA